MSYSQWFDKENVFRNLSPDELLRVSGGEGGFDGGEGGEGGEGGAAAAPDQIVVNGTKGSTSQDTTILPINFDLANVNSTSPAPAGNSGSSTLSQSTTLPPAPTSQPTTAQQIINAAQNSPIIVQPTGSLFNPNGFTVTGKFKF